MKKIGINDLLPQSEIIQNINNTSLPYGSSYEVPLTGKQGQLMGELMDFLEAVKYGKDFSGECLPAFSPADPSTWDDAKSLDYEEIARFCLSQHVPVKRVESGELRHYKTYFQESNPATSRFFLEGVFVILIKSVPESFSYRVDRDESGDRLFLSYEPDSDYEYSEAANVPDIVDIVMTRSRGELNSGLGSIFNRIRREAERISKLDIPDATKYQTLLSWVSTSSEQVNVLSLSSVIAKMLSVVHWGVKYEHDHKDKDV